MQESYLPETPQQADYNAYLDSTPQEGNVLSGVVDSLAAKKQEKITQLSEKKGVPQEGLLTPDMPHLDSKEFEMGGYLERGGNKLFNDLSDYDMQSLTGQAIADYQLQTDEQGNAYYMQNGEKVAYGGESKYLYGYTGEDGKFKLGVSRGDLPSSDYRYQPGRAEAEGFDVGKKGYGWAPGEEGLQVENKQMEILLPAEVASRLENLYHGREGSLENRLLRKPVDAGEEFYDARESIGGGYTEYYTSKEGLFGDSREGEQGDAKELYQKFLGLGGDAKQVTKQLTTEEIDELAKQREAENMGVGDRALNTLKAFGAGIVKYGVVQPLDAALELTNLGDLGAEEQTTEMVNKWFGYNDAVLDEPMKRAKELAGGILEGIKSEDKNVDVADVFELMKIGVTNTEIMADSIGYVGAMFIPYLGVAGKGLTASKGVSAVEKAYKAGNMSKAAAIAQVKQLNKQADVVTKSARLLQKEAGLLVVSAGAVNNQIDEFVEEHGESPSLGKIAQMYTTQVAMNGLDKWVTVDILKKTPGLTKAVKEATKALEVPEYAKLATKMLGIAGVVSANAGKEAAQEYLQTIGEVVNVQWDFDKDGNVTQAMSSLGDVLIEDETQIEGIMGAGIGAGVGVDMTLASEAVGAMTSPAVTNKLQEGLDKASNAMTSSTTPEVDPGVNEQVNLEVEEASKESAEELWEGIVQAAAGDRIAKGELEGVNLRGLAPEDLTDAEWGSVATQLLQGGSPSQLGGILATLNVGGRSREAQVLGQKLIEADPGNWNVQGSDPTVFEDSVTAAAVARLEADDSPEMVRDSIRSGIGRELSDSQVDSIVQEAVQEVEYARTLKSLGEVSQEAASGSRGFMTYYSKARYGESQKIRDTALAALSKFAQQHESKLDVVDTARSELKNQINRAAMSLMNDPNNTLRDDKAYTRAPASLKTPENEEALLEMVAYKQLAAQYGGSKETSGVKPRNTVQVDYGARDARGRPYSFKIGKWTVAEELHDEQVQQLKQIDPSLDQNFKVLGKAPEASGYLGTYKALEDEVKSMRGLLSNLLDRQPTEARVEGPVTEAGEEVGEPVEIESAKESARIAEYAAPEPLMKPIEEVAEPAELPTSMLPDEDIPTSIPQEPSMDALPEVNMSNFPDEGPLEASMLREAIPQDDDSWADAMAEMVLDQEAEKQPVVEESDVPEVMSSRVKARLEAQRIKMKEQIREARKPSTEYNNWEKNADAAEVEVAKEIANRPAYAKQVVADRLGDEFFQELVDNKIAKLREKEPNRDFSRTEAALIDQYIKVQRKLGMKLVELGCK